MPLVPGERTARLTRSASVVLDAAGNGRVELGPPDARTLWDIARLAVLVTGAGDPQPIARVYDGDENPANFIDGTFTGAQDVSDTSLQLHAGERLTCVWSAGEPGETATFRLIGRLVTLGG